MLRIALVSLLAVGCTSSTRGAFAPDADVDDRLPTVSLEYSFALDDFCSPQTVPEPLLDWQLALIAKIPTYRAAVVSELPRFQQSWDAAAPDLLAATVRGGNHPFERKDVAVALFLCPRLPSMGTPLSINVIAYLKAAVPDIPTLTDLDGDGVRDPLPQSLFVAITYHELLHKYLNDVADLTSSPLLDGLPGTFTADLSERDVMLLKAHLHLFALRRWVYEDVGLHAQFPLVKAIEQSHGPAYRRAWEMVHDRTDYYQRLLDEIRAART